MRDTINYVSLRDLVNSAADFGVLYFYITVDVNQSVVKVSSKSSRKVRKKKAFTHDLVVLASTVTYIGGVADEVEEVIGRWYYRTRIGTTETESPDDETRKSFATNRTIFDKLMKMIEAGEFEGLKSVTVKRGTVGGQAVPGHLDFDTEPIVASLSRDMEEAKKLKEEQAQEESEEAPEEEQAQEESEEAPEEESQQEASPAEQESEDAEEAAEEADVQEEEDASEDSADRRQ